MGVGQQSARNLLVRQQHLNPSKHAAPQARFHPTTIHCLITRFCIAAPHGLIVRCQEVPMALITIKDLPQSDDLDREAMRSIIGGGRIGVWPPPLDQAKAVRGRIVDYPPGFSRRGPILANPAHPAA
jgi:hypothetical protein